MSKIVASVSKEGLGIGDASMLFAGGAVSSMSASGQLIFSLSVMERLQVRVVLSRRHPTRSSPTDYGLTCWLKRIKIHKLESRRSTPLELETVTGTAQCGRC